MMEFLLHWPGQIMVAFLLDMLLGDPERFFHPVRCMGKAIQMLEPFLRGLCSSLRAAGILLAVLLVGASALATWALLIWADSIGSWLGALFRIYFFYACLGIGDLSKEVRGVLSHLRSADTVRARQSLSRIVGRDTKDLSGNEILRALVETIAESTCDGIVAVLFYSFLGGPILAMAFKAASTLDSMVGYKDDMYCQLGWASARLDDALNYLPARITAVVAVVVSIAVGASPSRALKAVLRDAKKQPSPNSGYPEAAFAGALGVRLGGKNFYRGIPVIKAALGDPCNELEISTAERALELMLLTAFVSMIIGVVVTKF